MVRSHRSGPSDQDPGMTIESILRISSTAIGATPGDRSGCGSNDRHTAPRRRSLAGVATFHRISEGSLAVTNVGSSGHGRGQIPLGYRAQCFARCHRLISEASFVRRETLLRSSFARPLITALVGTTLPLICIVAAPSSDTRLMVVSAVSRRRHLLRPLISTFGALLFIHTVDNL
jgi:hypothetical protein